MANIGIHVYAINKMQYPSTQSAQERACYNVIQFTIISPDVSSLCH